MEELLFELWKNVLEPFISFFGGSLNFLRWSNLTLLALLVTLWFFRKRIARWVVNEKYEEHDKTLFKEFDILMSEAEVRDFLSSLKDYAIYSKPDSSCAHLIEEGAKSIEKTFLNSDIDKPFKTFAKELGDLTLFMALNFIPYGEDRYRMKPTVKEKAREGDKEAEEYWNQLNDTLSGHCEKTLEAYEKYRKEVKKRLSV